MKKIFTLLFFAGFVTTATFAQSGKRSQNGNRSGQTSYQSNQHAGNSQDRYSSSAFSKNGSYGTDKGNYRDMDHEGYQGGRDRYAGHVSYEYQNHHDRRREDRNDRRDRRDW